MRMTLLLGTAVALGWAAAAASAATLDDVKSRGTLKCGVNSGLAGFSAPDDKGEPWWQTHPFPVDEEEGICGFWSFLCREESVGRVEIVDRDARVAPMIDHDYLAAAGDIAHFTDAYEANRALLATAPFAKPDSGSTQRLGRRS